MPHLQLCVFLLHFPDLTHKGFHFIVYVLFWRDKSNSRHLNKANSSVLSLNSAFPWPNKHNQTQHSDG